MPNKWPKQSKENSKSERDNNILVGSNTFLKDSWMKMKRRRGNTFLKDLWMKMKRRRGTSDAVGPISQTVLIIFYFGSLHN